jgi:hypothetical protein
MVEARFSQPFPIRRWPRLGRGGLQEAWRLMPDATPDHNAAGPAHAPRAAEDCVDLVRSAMGFLAGRRLRPASQDAAEAHSGMNNLRSAEL